MDNFLTHRRPILPSQVKDWQANSEREAWIACYAIASNRGGTPTPLIMYKISYMGNVQGMIGGFGSFERTYADMLRLSNTINWKDMLKGAMGYIHANDRKTLYANCAEIIYSAIMLGTAETAFLSYLRECLQLDEETCSVIERVTAIRQKKDNKQDFTGPC